MRLLIFALFSLCLCRELWLCSAPAAFDLSFMLLDQSSWPVSYRAIETLLFYGQQWYDGQCPLDQCGPNTFQMFNTTGAGYRLSQLGKYVAFETGVVKDWSCDGVGAQAAFNLTVQHMDVFDIKPAFVNMDEPLLSGRAAPCTQSDDVTARAVVRWMNQATQHVPQLQINDVEPYPYFSASELVAWIQRLASMNPQGLSGLHLDVDFNAVRNKKIKNPCKDIAQVRQAAQELRLSFGVIVNDNGGNPPARNNQMYAKYVSQNIEQYWSNTECLAPTDRVVFQSWVANGVPLNLPESDPTSLTGLLAAHINI